MREPVQMVELDYEGCALTFGAGACTASLGARTPRKCYATFATCAAKAAFAPVARTLRFAEARAALSPQLGAFPALVSVSARSATVNIAGSDDRMSALGRRATVTVELADFAYHDRATDPYQAERASGAAQIDEPGYDPAARGSFFTKLRARWPYYTGRALRVIDGYLDGGVLTLTTTRHYVITDWAGPDDRGRVRIEGKDALSLADNARALAPSPSAGVLSADIDAAALTLSLSPAGIGAQYQVSGRAMIGSEIMSFTRAGDVLTLGGRGLAGSVAAAHKAGDTVQTVLHINDFRVDDTVAMLLRDFAGVPTAYLPVADWAAEVSRWMPQIRLQTHICTPTGVAALVGELAVIGVSIWWDEVAQRVRLRCNRPAVEGAIALTDAAHLTGISVEDRNEDRLTEILFFTVQLDPTKSATAPDNYARVLGTYDFEAKSALAFADTRVRKIFCRWFNGGADSEVRQLARRLLNRFRMAPQHVRMTLDAKDGAIRLGDVLSVSSRVLTDVTGKPEARALQVIALSEPVPGHQVEVTAQAFDFSGRYGFCTESSRPSYSASSEAQRASGNYAVADATLTFPDGSGPYRAI